jgi:hypothetical protein
MTSLHVDVADVETVARAARSDTKAAISYLVCSGAVAITIIENVKGCSFKVGSKISARGAMVFWLREAEAPLVLKAARRIAGRKPDIAQAENALYRAAADQRVTLTEHATAMMRAGDAAAKLDAYLASLKGTGLLSELNKAYRRKRMAAQLRGEGYMSYGTVMLRFKKALIPMLLQNGATVGPTQSLFAQIFDR